MIELDNTEGLARTGHVTSSSAGDMRLPALLHLRPLEGIDGLLLDDRDIGDGMETRMELPFFHVRGNALSIDVQHSHNPSRPPFLTIASRPYYPPVPGTDPSYGIDVIEGPKGQVPVLTLPSLEGLKDNPGELVGRVVRAREIVGTSGLIYAPACATPVNLALLIYLGVDIVDTSRALLDTAGGRALTLSPEPPHPPAHPGSVGELVREMELVRSFLGAGRLRELVESRCAMRPGVDSALRYLDERYYGALERGSPVFRPGAFLCSSTLALSRPEVKRYQRRLSERYVPPPSPDILLLLPCSMRKPYSISKSHRKFRDILRGFRGSARVHEVILTSPMGLVPRELESVFPVRAYDIGVAGIWNPHEEQLIRKLLGELLERKHYPIVISHFPDTDIIRDVLDRSGSEIHVTCTDHRPTSPGSLHELETALGEIPPSPSDRRRRFVEDMEALGSYQFGPAALKLLKDTIPRGKGFMYKIFNDTGGQIGMLIPERGTIVLTARGGERLAVTGAYRVTIGDFEPRGDILAVGVEAATEDIRVGDEVVVVDRGGRVMGVGVAKMDAGEMLALERGMAVSLRHRIKGSGK